MDSLFGWLQHKGFEVGCPVSTKVPDEELFDVANGRFSNHVRQCSVTFPVIHYFLHHHSIRSNWLLTFVKKESVGVFLRCLALDPKRRHEWCLARTVGQTVKVQQELLHHIDDVCVGLRDEVPREEIEAELGHLWQHWHLATKKDTPAPAPRRVEQHLDLFHPLEEVQNFRSLVQGRSWFPPSFFSVLFIMWHQRTEFPWTILPPSMVNHKKGAILDLLKAQAPPVSALVWIRLCEDLPTSPLPSATAFVQSILGTDHPDANAMLLTRSVPNWQECWTRKAWPMRRSITRKLRLQSPQPASAELVQLVTDLYSS